MSSPTPEAGPSRLSVPPPSPASPTETPAGFESWRQSLARITGLGLSEQEKASRDSENERQKLEKQWDRCERMKSDLMTKSPMLVFMLKHLQLAGCPFPSESIQCHPCDTTHAGGFAPDFGILICQDRFYSKKHLEDTLAHELLHAYDHCRFKVDWSNLRHHACSEIRAANLSGDCRWGRETQRGFYGFNKQHQACVKRRAILSVRGNPNCKSEEQAELAVNQVWDSCFADTRPFDEIYK